MKRFLLASSFLALGVSSAFAQTTDVPADEDVIVVTGSRIPVDPNLVSPVPVQSLDAEAIRLSGEISLADIINDVPALVSSTTSEQSATGANALNLRGLGTARTLTLVNGRRHISGFAGTQAVDIGSIPQALIERVEVLTGGASAIYGADAVTGVVNFVLKDDFEGLDLDLQGNISDQGDGESIAFRGLYGKNFDNDRGNVTIALDYIEDSVLRNGDRDLTRDNRLAETFPNPAFGTPGAFPRVVNFDPRFSISSDRGLIAFQDFGASGLDLNNNGVEDCQDSSVGQNWLGIGFGGCHVVADDGSIRVFEDGLVARSTNQFGGDGVPQINNLDTLFPSVDTVTINLNTSYDLSNNLEAFFEGKYSASEAQTFAELNGFFDLAPVSTENPFIPAILQPAAIRAGGLYVNKDPRDLVTGEFDTNERETVRFVGGLRGEMNNGWNWEVAGNYGEFNVDFNDANYMLLDRFFAAIDVVEDPTTGAPICRSDIDPTATPPATPFGIPAFDEGIFTFTPGDGQCAPYNLFGGIFGASEEAVNFITTSVTDSTKVKQTVLSAIISGTTEEYFSMPAGPIGFAGGFEYRKEESQTTINPFDQGIIPAGAANAGQLVSSVSGNESLGFNGGTSRFTDSGGEYDVIDIFAEARVPLIRDYEYIESFDIDGAVRFADYSTSGLATTWKAGGNIAFKGGLSFRSTISRAIRAPNINELFDPVQPIFVRPEDPCDITNISAAPNPSLRQENCNADGVPTGFRDPLTARFPGTSGGNPDLQVEKADTLTVGGVFTPSFIQGLSVTVDYWDVSIDDSIGTINSQQIVNACYDATNFPSDFCDLFTRNRDAGSPTFLGFTSLQSNTLNFARQEAEGIDFAVDYGFDLGLNDIGLRVVGTRQLGLDDFFDPTDLENENPRLAETRFPEWSGNAVLSIARGAFSGSVQGSYQSRQALSNIEIETIETQYGDAGFSKESFIFDANMSYAYDDRFTVYGGVNNFTNEEPFITVGTYPSSPRGRMFFLGVNYRM